VAGDPAAFGELFARHRDRLWAVALRTLHDPDDAADALQEAMISAFRRAGHFRGDAAVTTWLHRIVVNACLDQLRRKPSKPTVPMDGEAALDALGWDAKHGRPGGAAADPTAASDTALDVGAALRLLPAEQRAALVLVDMLGYSVAAAADVLGVSPGTVKSRCSRGRARLLPHLTHLRSSHGSAGQTGNQAPAGDVSSPSAAAPAAVSGVGDQANPADLPSPAPAPTPGGGSTDRDQSP
jgi:RNA polymerase sigma-70 factor (ECF subfamily)